MLNIYKSDTGRLTVAEAKRWFLQHSPRFVSVYGQQNGTPDGTVKGVHDEKPKSIHSAHLNEDFESNCAQVEVVPSWKDRTDQSGYTSNPETDELCTISHDEFVRLARLFDLAVKPRTDMQVFITSARPLRVERALQLMNPAEQVEHRESIGGIQGRGETTAGDYIDYIKEMIERQAAGFFTVGEAAQILADIYPAVELKRLLAQMKEAFQGRALTIRGGDRFPLLKKDSFGRVACMVEVSDFDAWLVSTNAGYRFPKVAGDEWDFFTLEQVAASIKIAKFPQTVLSFELSSKATKFEREVLRDLGRAVKANELEAYNPILECAWVPPPNDTCIWVKAEAVNEYLSKAGRPYRFREVLEPMPLDTASNATSIVEKPMPPSLTTGDIAASFKDIRRSEAGWMKLLGNKPKWLESCVVIPGRRGVRERRWDPVCIGAALIVKGKAQAHQVRAKFQTNHLLKPWLEAWKTYEAEHIDA